MPVPKKRHSNTRTNKRRANWKLQPVNLGSCSQCGAPVLPHYACGSCGTYQGRAVIKIEEKKEKKQRKEQAAAEKEKKETKKEEKSKKEKSK